MPYRITGEKTLTVGTTARDVDVGCRGFYIQNNSDAAVVYFREKSEDGAAATAGKGFAVQPGVTLGVFEAETLSVIASAAATDARLLFIDMG